MRFWNKKIKNVSEIARETGIEEKKIKELKEGKREIGGETMEKVLNAINKIERKTDMEKKVEKEEVMNWYKNTDLDRLMKEFGYERQKDCAKEIGIGQSSLCELINRKAQHYTKVMQKVYNFFNDEFNKNVNNKTKRAYHKKIRKSNDKLKYLQDLELNNIMTQLECKTHEQLAKKIGISRRTLESIFNGNIKSDSKLVNKTYNYVKTKISQANPHANERNDENDINILADNKTLTDGTKNTEKTDDIYKGLWEVQTLKISMLEKQVERYEKQIERYEKLIDLIK